MGKTSTEEILDAAEHRCRAAGYNGFSFRDLATDVGVKSASIHHHFPTKPALVTALAQRYSTRFFDHVKDVPAGECRVAAYRNAFRTAIEEHCAMCLFGILGSEADGLPDEVSKEATAFYTRAVAHLSEGLDSSPTQARRRATAIMAQLEGAIIMARTLDGLKSFDDATEGLVVPEPERV